MPKKTARRGGPRTVLYLRVSKKDQTIENQRQALATIAEARGWAIMREYQDEAYSGALKRDRRPGFDGLMRDARARAYDRALFWAVDRLGRSTAQITAAMEELDGYGVEQFYLMEGMDTSTPHGQAMLEMSAVFAKLERGHLISRINAGLDRARASGKRLGRSRLAPDRENQIRAVLRQKNRPGVQKIAKRFKVGTGTVQRILKALDSEPPAPQIDLESWINENCEPHLRR